VRGRIEKLQGEYEYLKHDVEMSVITVQIRPEAVAHIAGWQWHPMASIRAALSDTGKELASYVDAMVAFIIYLPILIVWGGTFLVIGIAGYRVYRIAERRWKPKEIIAG
jgi:hypothetical protein